MPALKTAYNVLEEIFTNQINVLNMAVEVSPLDLNGAKASCRENNFDVHLVKEPGKDDLTVYVKKTDSVRPVNDSEIIADSTPILDVLEVLCDKEHLFVKVSRNITHIVTRSDLDKIPIRIWLYGIISLFEIELKVAIIDKNIQWEKSLAPGRIKNAEKLFDLKKQKNEEIDLLGCTQLCDIGTIVFNSWECFDELFPLGLSKKKIKSGFKKINGLRDALAHGQKLPMDWPELYRLANFISYTLKRINSAA